jgi:hypothetical protein
MITAWICPGYPHRATAYAPLGADDRVVVLTQGLPGGV